MNEEQRPSVHINSVTAGTRLRADRGFTCMTENQVYTVKNDRVEGFYLRCRDGIHYLDSQLYGDRYVGFVLMNADSVREDA